MAFPFAIFDIDGTLVDSRRIIQDAMARAFEAIKRPPPSYDQTRRIVGLGLEAALLQLAPDLAEADRPRLLHAYRDAFIANRALPGFKEPLYEGALDTLERLQRHGWVMGVATGKSRRGLDAILEMHGLAGFFTTLWCADDGPGKPHPHMVVQAMAAVGAEPIHSVMIGDATHDMAMARAAGAYAQGVSWGFATADEVAHAGAHHVAHTFGELNAALDAWAEKRPVSAA
jgi:phosphoglycolate phosphatase